MPKKLRLLIVDDHPMTVKGYRISLECSLKLTNLYIKTAFNIDDSLRLLKKSKSSAPFELVLLDINLPPSKEKNILNGEELGVYIRQKHPETKIIVLTMLNDPERINGIAKNLRPEGFLLKTETTPNVLEDSILQIRSGKSFYGKGIKKVLMKSNGDETLDSYDLKILYHISRGEKTKNLPKHLPFSLPTIERRKRNIKTALGISNADDKTMLELARKKGYL